MCGGLNWVWAYDSDGLRDVYLTAQVWSPKGEWTVLTETASKPDYRSFCFAAQCSMYKSRHGQWVTYAFYVWLRPSQITLNNSLAIRGKYNTQLARENNLNGKMKFPLVICGYKKGATKIVFCCLHGNPRSRGTLFSRNGNPRKLSAWG